VGERKRRRVFTRVVDGMDLWEDYELAVRTGRRFVVLPTGTMLDLLQRAHVKRGWTVERDAVVMIDEDNV